MKQTNWWARGAVTSVSVLLASTAQASGFRIPEVSLSGLGQSNAQVADDKEIGALPYNPAAMSFHEGTNATAGILMVDPNISVTTTTGTHDSEGRSPAYIPNLYIMGHITEPVTWGLAINSPFGLETKWPSGTFPLPAAASPTLSKLEMVNINPNMALRFGNTSVALGVDYYNVLDVNLNTATADVYGDGAEFGYNLAAMHIVGPVTLGASYRSAITVDIDGKVNTLDAKTELKLPWMFQMGARYRISAPLAVELDFERTGWSEFDEILITTSSPLVTIRSTNNWEDANAYRLGGSYDVGPNTQLRFGYTFDETGQPDSRFNARIPDADRHLLSVGVKQNVAGWGLEAGYMYVKFEDRTVTNTAPLGTYGSDANGTSAYNGTYEASVHLLGFGVSKKF